MSTTTASPTLTLPPQFSAPASCFSTITFQADGALVLGYGPACVPSGADTSERAYAFSPALHCPLSYTTAGQVTLTTIGTVVESRAICCPTLNGIPLRSGYTMSYNPDIGTLTRDPWYSTLGCTVSFTQWETFTVLSNGTITALSFHGGFNAYSVQIAWQSSDIASVSATPTPTGLPSSLSRTTSSSPTASATSLPPSTPNGDLSTGAKAAIGVLAPLAVLGLLLAIILFVRYRRRMRSHGVPQHPGSHKKSSQNGPGILMEESDALRH